MKRILNKLTGLKMRETCAVLAAAFLLFLMPGKEIFAAGEALVSNGIFLSGIDVGGMTREQVMEAARSKIEELGQTQVTVSVDENSSYCTLAELGLTWSNSEIVDELLHLGATGNIVKRYKDRKDLEHENKRYSMKFDLSKEKALSCAESFSSFNTEPVNASIYTQDDLTPGVEGGTEGITVDTQAAVDELISLVRGWDGQSALSLQLPVSRTEPEVTYDELAMISDVLGTATTDYSASSYARATNVENGCRKISGTLLYPDDWFSVTEAVSPFTAENGYEQAPSYEENRVVDSYGGGICQVSTTLYNAVLKAELEVTDRSNHTMVVSYVPLSKDAAIAEGVMDMSFVNTSEWPVYIIGYCYGGQITFTIYGHETRPANRTLEFESRTVSTIEPTAAKLFANASQPVGYISQTQSPHTGYVAELWKNIYIDGVLSDSVQVNTSQYTAVGTIYDIGVQTDNAAVSQAIMSAISAGDLAGVQSAIANASAIAAQAESEAAAQEAAAQEAAAAQTQVDSGGNVVVIDEAGDVDESAMQ